MAAARTAERTGGTSRSNTASARLALEHDLSDRPRDARVRYMMGGVAFSEGKHAEALALDQPCPPEADE